MKVITLHSEYCFAVDGRGGTIIVTAFNVTKESVDEIAAAYNDDTTPVQVVLEDHTGTFENNRAVYVNKFHTRFINDKLHAMITMVPV